MTDQELIEKLNNHLNEINEMLVLGDMGLLKSEEMYGTKHKIEDALKIYQIYFEKIESLKIEKTIPAWRNIPRSGLFLTSSQVNPELSPLHILLQELIKVKGGSEQVISVAVPELKITGSTINQAINDAKTLLSTQSATSALDRVHTVLHGYLKQVCIEAGISYKDDDTLNQMMKSLKASHPAFIMQNNNTDEILRGMANIFDKLNPLRNNSSLAHSNSILLKPEEAMLVINSVNSLLSYLNSKFSK